MLLWPARLNIRLMMSNPMPCPTGHFLYSILFMALSVLYIGLLYSNHSIIKGKFRYDGLWIIVHARGGRQTW